MLLVFAALWGFDYSAEVKRAVGFAVNNERCEDGAAASDAIVVCGTRRTNHFRIEQSVRKSWHSDGTRRAAPTTWLSWGRTGTGSCSAVGPGGYTGCLSRQIQNWKAGGGRVHF